MVLTAEDVGDRLAEARERIKRAGGTCSAVSIVAVTKGFGQAAVDAAVAVGVTDIGENYADELLARRPPPSDEPVRWHFLGHVQRNKVRRIASVVHLWQAVDRMAAGNEIARRAPGAAVLVQVNISGEPQKHGCRPDDAPSLVEGLDALGLSVRGLMAVGPTGPPELARAGYRRLARAADRLGLAERSMGMSDDLEVAVQEGATMLRLGRALFGDRPAAPAARR